MLIADYAPENLDGLYVGAHARVYESQLVEPANGVSADFGWLWFGVGHPQAVPANYVLYYLLASAYEPPEVLKQIAHGSQPALHPLERKRTRNRWRFHDDLAWTRVQDHVRAPRIRRRLGPGWRFAADSAALLGCDVVRARRARRPEYLLHNASVLVDVGNCRRTSSSTPMARPKA